MLPYLLGLVLDPISKLVLAPLISPTVDDPLDLKAGINTVFDTDAVIWVPPNTTDLDTLVSILLNVPPTITLAGWDDPPLIISCFAPPTIAL